MSSEKVMVRLGNRETEAVRFRDGDPPIYVMDDGRFAVNQDGHWVVRPTVKGLEALIAGSAKFVQLFAHDGTTSVSRESSPKVHAVVRLLENGRYEDPNGKKQYGSRWGNLYLFDQKIIDQLTELEKRRFKYEQEVSRDLERILRKAVKVDSENFQQMKEKHGQSREQSRAVRE